MDLDWINAAARIALAWDFGLCHMHLTEQSINLDDRRCRRERNAVPPRTRREVRPMRVRVCSRRWVPGSGERYGNGEQGSTPSVRPLRAHVHADATQPKALSAVVPDGGIQGQG